MPSVKVVDLLALVQRALEGAGLSAAAATEEATEFVAAELAGTRSHGLGKVISLDFGDTSVAATIETSGSLVVANGNGGSGFAVLRQVVDVVAETVREHGVAVGFIRNFSRYNSLYPYVEALADLGYIAMLANAGGPTLVAPYGSIDPLTGTNPIAFSFPTTEGIQTIDFATSAVVWGAVRQAAREGVDLPTGAFIDMDGREVRSPAHVNAVRAFGGAKGSALNIALELLTSGIVGAEVGSAAKSQFDLGAFLLAVDPARVGDTNFSEKASAFFEEIRCSRPEVLGGAVRVPGDRPRGRALVQRHHADSIDVSDKIMEGLEARALRRRNRSATAGQVPRQD